MIWDLYDLDWPRETLKPSNVTKQQKPYSPSRDEILVATRPYVAKPLWSAFDKVVAENASLGDILQRVKDEELVSEHDQIPFETDLRKLYQKSK